MQHLILLARTTVISSSNGDAAVNFTSGTKDVFCTLPASKAVYLDASGSTSRSSSAATEGFAISNGCRIIGKNYGTRF